jgi:spore coat protein U-like protein
VSFNMTHLWKLGRTARSWVAALFVLALAYGGASAQAGTANANLTVQITITASCTINAATLDFGSNPGTNLISANVDTSTTVSVTCTNAAPYSIGMDNGAHVTGSQRRMLNGASNFLNYNLYTDAARLNAWTTASSSTTCTTANSCALGTGNGSAQSVNIYGRVPIVATAPTAGAYTDTVVMTITY